MIATRGDSHSLANFLKSVSVSFSVRGLIFNCFSSNESIVLPAVKFSNSIPELFCYG